MDQQSGNAYARASLANIKEAAANNTKQLARVFRSNVQSVKYVFKNGKVAAFMQGKYTTDIKYEIDELDEEIAAGHPNFSANKEEVVELIEPMEVLRSRFIAEYIANQKSATSGTNDAGNSEFVKLNVATSDTVKAGMAGSDGSGQGTAPAATGPPSLKIAVK